MYLPDRWEQGSDFHLHPEFEVAQELPRWSEASVLFGSGRDALRALLDYGSALRGWKRLWIPSYFCQDVVPALARSGLEIVAYPDNPMDDGTAWERATLRPADVVLRVNYLGLRALEEPREKLPRGLAIIDDHTHDPFSTSATSSASDWCVASLRKTLPLPDGGVLWSPAGHALPEAPIEAPAHSIVAMKKLAAMALKAAYLTGGDVQKGTFRELYQSSEACIGQGPVSGISSWSRSMLGGLPVSQWRTARRHNYNTLAEALVGANGITILRAQGRSDVCPLVVAVVCDTAARQKVIRQALIDARVYPAVLWPLDEPLVLGVREYDMDLSRRILCLHCDMRYDTADMLRVANLVRQASGAAAGSAN
jgi:hypothetical protein